MNARDVLIVILNWNGSEDTLDCLASLRNSDAKEARILVVDNGSSPKQLQRLQRGYAGEILALDRNLGFTGAINLALRKYDSPLWLFLNNDALVEERFLEPLQEAVERGRLDLASPLIYREENGKPGLVWFGSCRINWWLGRPMALRDYAPSEAVLPYPCGCCFLAKQSTLGRLGGLYEPYFAYFEDTDLGLRASAAGYRSGIVTTSRILHKVSAATGEGSPFRIYLFTRNRIWFMRRHARWWHWPSFFLVQILLRSVYSLRYLAGPAGAGGLRSFFKGTWDGFRRLVDPPGMGA